MKANSKSVFPECIHFLEVKSLCVKLIGPILSERVLYKTEDSGFHYLCTTLLLLLLVVLSGTKIFTLWRKHNPVESSLVEV